MKSRSYCAWFWVSLLWKSWKIAWPQCELTAIFSVLAKCTAIWVTRLFPCVKTRSVVRVISANRSTNWGRWPASPCVETRNQSNISKTIILTKFRHFIKVSRIIMSQIFTIDIKCCDIHGNLFSSLISSLESSAEEKAFSSQVKSDAPVRE
jgi:hypothetical protein